MATIEEDFDSINSQIEDAIGFAVINLHGELQRVAPVDTGFFKASWKEKKLGKLTWKIFNDAPYASFLWRGHLKQWNGGDSMLLKANLDLERECKRIRA